MVGSSDLRFCIHMWRFYCHHSTNDEQMLSDGCSKPFSCVEQVPPEYAQVIDTCLFSYVVLRSTEYGKWKCIFSDHTSLRRLDGRIPLFLPRKENSQPLNNIKRWIIDCIKKGRTAYFLNQRGEEWRKNRESKRRGNITRERIFSPRNQAESNTEEIWCFTRDRNTTSPICWLLCLLFTLLYFLSFPYFSPVFPSCFRSTNSANGSFECATHKH